MYYIHYFETQAEHDTKHDRLDNDYLEPWVGVAMDTGNVSYDLPFAYVINYNITHLTATTMPRLIYPGETGTTIVISPETNHLLPFVVHVSGATLSSYNRSTGEIVITNPTDNIRISADAICVDYRIIWPGAVNNYTSQYYYIGVFSNGQSNHRATLLVPRNGLVHACEWGTVLGGVTSDGYSHMQNYSTIPIPEGATTVKITLSGSSYNVSIGILDRNGANQKTSEWSTAQNAPRSFTLADYPNATHVACTFRRSNDSNFTSTPTMSQLGFSLIFE